LIFNSILVLSFIRFKFIANDRGPFAGAKTGAFDRVRITARTFDPGCILGVQLPGTL